MSFAAEKINSIRQQEQKDKSESYIDSNYDLKFIFTPADAQSNFILHLSNALVGMLNQITHLPRVIIVMLDSDFTRITAGYKTTEKAIGCLVSQLIVAIGKHKGQVLKKSYRSTEPKFLIMKPTPWAAGLDEFRGSHNQCRIFNRQLELVISKYDYFYTYNVHKIQPEKGEFFDYTKSNLSELGFKTYWRAVNDAVQ